MSERVLQGHQIQADFPTENLLRFPNDFYLSLKKDFSQKNINLMRQAYTFASRAHDGQERMDGKPYISHPLEVAKILVEMNMDTDSICAGLMHDVLEDCDIEKRNIDKVFGKDVSEIVDGVSKIGKLDFQSKSERNISSLQKMALAMAKDVRVIVTSRVIGYQPQQLRDAEFYHFMLQDLESEQVEDFIQRWHDLTYQNESEKERKRERLKRAIKDSSAIKQLSGNPLLLTMMAILNRHQELPRDRAELYNQASRILLQQWDMERALIDAKIDPITIDYKDKQAILRRVADFMQQNKEGLAGNLIHGDDLENIIKD